MVVSHTGMMFKLMEGMSRLLRRRRFHMPVPLSDERIMFGLFAMLSCTKSGK
jgi:hypothetical protein